MGFGALSVKGRALRYLAQREHSRQELERKLARHVQDTEAASAQAQIEAALDQLAATGQLTDSKTLFALHWLQRWRAGQWSLQWTEPGVRT